MRGSILPVKRSGQQNAGLIASKIHMNIVDAGRDACRGEEGADRLTAWFCEQLFKLLPHQPFRLHADQCRRGRISFGDAPIFESTINTASEAS